MKRPEGSSRWLPPLRLSILAVVAAAASSSVWAGVPPAEEPAVAAAAATPVGAAAAGGLAGAAEPPCSCGGGEAPRGPPGAPTTAHTVPPAEISGVSREGVYFIPEPLSDGELQNQCEAEERGLPSCPLQGPPQGWDHPSSYTASLVFTPGGTQRLAAGGLPPGAAAGDGADAAATAAAAAGGVGEGPEEAEQCVVEALPIRAASFKEQVEKVVAAAQREIEQTLGVPAPEAASQEAASASSPSSPSAEGPSADGSCLKVRAPTLLERRKQFLAEFGEDYSLQAEQTAQRELRRLRGDIYLDYAGSALYEESRVLAVFKDLATHVFGNAHSRNPSANLTDKRTREARLLTLDFFGAAEEEFAVVFTSGATAAIKLVGEDFPFTSESSFFYLRINHNSVLGVRELAYAAGVQSVKALSEGEVEAVLGEREAAGRETDWSDAAGLPNCLFGFPLKDNFNGVSYPLKWIQKIHRFGLSDGCRWYVLLDVAAAAPTTRIRLSGSAPDASADFLATSFYKVFGYPTGLGALVVKRSAAAILKKIYWGGGSVAGSLCDSRWQQLKKDVSARLEDGTVNFLSIAAIKHGFEALKALEMHKIERHVAALTRHLFRSLRALRHRNGAPFALLYWGRKEDPTGGIVTFNLLKPDGSFVPFNVVEAKTAAAGIHLRTGCFCNPGGCQDYLGLTGAEIVESTRARESCSDPIGALLNSSGFTAGGSQLMLPSRGKAVGAVRVSLGYLSTFYDLDGLIDFLVHTFLWQ